MPGGATNARASRTSGDAVTRAGRTGGSRPGPGGECRCRRRRRDRLGRQPRSTGTQFALSSSRIGQRHDRARRLPGGAVGHPREAAGPRPAGPERVDLRAVQRPPRHPGDARRGRAVQLGRHLPERLLRVVPDPLPGARLRLSRGRADDRRRDRRHAHPAAHGGRAARRAPRQPQVPRAGARLALGVLERHSCGVRSADALYG